MADGAHPVAAAASDLPDVNGLISDGEPVLLKGAVRHWPLVRAGFEGPRAAMEHLLSFYQGRPVVAYTGAPEIGGRFFYDAALTGMNFAAERTPLDTLLARIRDHLDDERAPSLYIGSTDIDGYLPGLKAENPPPFERQLSAHRPLTSVWIGNRTIASTHYDMSNNAACCAVGRRRFTLFPPDQIANLYPGPLEPTPGGQVVSMVDLRAPDLDRHPRFAKALEAARVFDLEPGDVLVYPALWWHDVEALDPFNVLINTWWNVAPAALDSPMLTLLHGLMSLRDRPAAEKAAWRSLFDFYVFGDAERAAAHLPEAAQGPLAPMDEGRARRLRAQLLNRLNR